jgi:hypothetical protein
MSKSEFGVTGPLRRHSNGTLYNLGESKCTASANEKATQTPSLCSMLLLDLVVIISGDVDVRLHGHCQWI